MKVHEVEFLEPVRLRGNRSGEMVGKMKAGEAIAITADAGGVRLQLEGRAEYTRIPWPNVRFVVGEDDAPAGEKKR